MSAALTQPRTSQGWHTAITGRWLQPGSEVGSHQPHVSCCFLYFSFIFLLDELEGKAGVSMNWYCRNSCVVNFVAPQNPEKCICLTGVGTVRTPTLCKFAVVSPIFSPSFAFSVMCSLHPPTGEVGKGGNVEPMTTPSFLFMFPSHWTSFACW